MRSRTSKANASSSHFTAAGTSGYSRTGMIAAAGMERFVRIQNASNSVHLGAVGPARFGHLEYRIEQWLVIEPVAESAYGVDDPLGASAARWAAASKTRADQPPPLSKQPYLGQTSG